MDKTVVVDHRPILIGSPIIACVCHYPIEIVLKGVSGDGRGLVRINHLYPEVDPRKGVEVDINLSCSAQCRENSHGVAQHGGSVKFKSSQRPRPQSSAFQVGCRHGGNASGSCRCGTDNIHPVDLREVSALLTGQWRKLQHRKILQTCRIGCATTGARSITGDCHRSHLYITALKSKTTRSPGRRRTAIDGTIRQLQYRCRL